MLEDIIRYITVIGMFFGAFLWVQTNYVDAMDFKQYQYDMVEAEVNYLKDKKLRLEKGLQELEYEDQRQLERQELKLQQLQQQLKK